MLCLIVEQVQRVSLGIGLRLSLLPVEVSKVHQLSFCALSGASGLLMSLELTLMSELNTLQLCLCALCSAPGLHMGIDLIPMSCSQKLVSLDLTL